MDTKSPPFKELDFSMKALGLRRVVKDPTRVVFREGVETSTMIDLIFTNSEVVNKVNLLDKSIRGHMGARLTRRKSWVKPVEIQFKGLSYKTYDKESFPHALSRANWEHMKASILIFSTVVVMKSAIKLTA